MRDGQIIKKRAWFGFDLADLYWLLDKIPYNDGFRQDLEKAIRELEAENEKP